MLIAFFRPNRNRNVLYFSGGQNLTGHLYAILYVLINLKECIWLDVHKPILAIPKPSPYLSNQTLSLVIKHFVNQLGSFPSNHNCFLSSQALTENLFPKTYVAMCSLVNIIPLKESHSPYVLLILSRWGKAERAGITVPQQGIKPLTILGDS